VEIEGPAATVGARLGRWAQVQPRTPSTCTMTMATDSLDWPLFALGSIGADFTVLSPPELRTLAAAWGARFARAGRDPGA
jgi:hypothetical protein